MEQIGSLTAQDIFPKHANQIISAASSCLHDIVNALSLDKFGGYLCVADTADGTPLIVVQVGSVPSTEKRRKYCDFSQEKAFRLAHHRGEISSWLSRNEAENKWGGAIRAGKFIFSFSGLTEQQDEIMAIYMAIKFGMINRRDMDEIMRASGNEENFEKLRGYIVEGIRKRA